MEKNNYRIGIVGGMGPMAGVLLQKLIIEATPAAKDQDHLEVVCFTNPHVPDRTESLRKDDGKRYVAAIVDSIKVLELAGVNCVVMPCNTAHARLERIQKAVRVPVLNMVGAALRALREDGVILAGLLATTGTVVSGVFSSTSDLQIIVPDVEAQEEIMRMIYEIKAGKYDDENVASRLGAIAAELQRKGARKVVLGCTELSLYSSFFKAETVVDPLREVAKEAVRLALAFADKKPFCVPATTREIS